jgi:UDP-N-acetyl-3-dehydro-alpha-D-glucosamine 3-aminotranferase
MIPQIDLKRQHEALRSELMDAAARVIDSCRFILGPEGQALERELAAVCGARHGLGTGSGTDALLIALKAVGVKPGDEVITSAFSFVASGTTILMAGATPVFVDIDPVTFNVDPARVEQAITARTRAIVPVHLYGQIAAMDTLCETARGHGLAVVADAAQAVGASYAGRPVSQWGDAATLSFYPTKNLGACGDAGMVLTTRDDVADHVRLLRDHGQPRRYTHVELGGSSRLDELQAALLRVKAGRLSEWNQRRRAIARYYTEALAELPLGLPMERSPAQHIYHQYTVRSTKRDALVAALGNRGVGTAIHYPSTIPAQPLFSYPNADRAFPVATQAAAEVLSLPCFPELTDGEVDAVVAAVKQAVREVM